MNSELLLHCLTRDGLPLEQHKPFSILLGVPLVRQCVRSLAVKRAFRKTRSALAQSALLTLHPIATTQMQLAPLLPIEQEARLPVPTLATWQVLGKTMSAQARPWQTLIFSITRTENSTLTL